MSKPNSNGTDVSTVEAAEHDPCMGPSSGKNSNVFVNFRSAVCKRWDLSHTVFYAGLGLAILAACLLIVVIALGAAWPHVPHSWQYPVCSDAECLRASAQIQEALNTSSSPCTDLWSWACGGWLERYPLPKDRSVWNQKQQIAKQEAARVRDLVTTLHLPLPVSSVEWKLKHLYDACLDVDNVNTDEARPLTNIITELGELLLYAFNNNLQRGDDKPEWGLCLKPQAGLFPLDGGNSTLCVVRFPYSVGFYSKN